MVFNTTFNNISVTCISYSVLLVEKTTDLSQVTDKLISRTPRHERDSTNNFSGDRH